jgi:hypothetical protein
LHIRPFRAAGDGTFLLNLSLMSSVFPPDYGALQVIPGVTNRGAGLIFQCLEKSERFFQSLENRDE